MTNEDLWLNSPFIGIITVTDGKYIQNKGYELGAEVNTVLKGRVNEYIKFKNMFPSMNTTNVLGATYLVYLFENSDKSYFVPSENFSVIEVIERSVEDRDMLEDIAKNKGVQYAHAYEYEGKLWHIQCWGAIRIFL